MTILTPADISIHGNTFDLIFAKRAKRVLVRIRVEAGICLILD